MKGFFFTETASSLTGVVAGSVGGALVLVTIILILVFLVYRRYTCFCTFKIGNIFIFLNHKSGCPWTVILGWLVTVYVFTSTVKANLTQFSNSIFMKNHINDILKYITLKPFRYSLSKKTFELLLDFVKRSKVKLSSIGYLEKVSYKRS